MKLFVLHGDNTYDSYDRLKKFIISARKRNWDIQKINSPSQNVSELLVSDSLFQKERLVVIENANLINKTTINWLQKHKNLVVTLVIYHPSTINKTLIKKLPNVEKVEEFKLPKLIWRFLDAFYPGNAKMLIQLLHEITKNEPVELVFSLLSRLLRDLYWVKVDPSTLMYPSWRIGKLKSQSNKFTEQKLKEIISEFAENDIKSKSSDVKLIDLLDFTIATKLE